MGGNATGAIAPFGYFDPSAPILAEAVNQKVRLFWGTDQGTALDTLMAVIDKVHAEMGANVFVHGLVVTFDNEVGWLCEATVS